MFTSTHFINNTKQWLTSSKYDVVKHYTIHNIYYIQRSTSHLLNPFIIVTAVYWNIARNKHWFSDQGLSLKKGNQSLTFNTTYLELS